MSLRIEVGGLKLEAGLSPRVCPRTVEAVVSALPIQGVVRRWGDEIYFEVPFRVEAENQQEVVEMGDLGYWPPGRAICIFFGRTPASRGDEIRPASPVNVFGKIKRGELEALKKVRDGENIVITWDTQGR